MHLYNLTLQRATGITHSVHGNFSGAKLQEIVVSRGKILELMRPDPNTGKVHTLLTVEIFGVIRSLMSFRLTGGNKDYVIVGSDSGRIVILEYNPTKNLFERVHMETFGKSGCRRIVPGQYLAIDPKGRAVMIAAVEKQKLVYILNRDTQVKVLRKLFRVLFDCLVYYLNIFNSTSPSQVSLPLSLSSQITDDKYSF